MKVVDEVGLDLSAWSIFGVHVVETRGSIDMLTWCSS